MKALDVTGKRFGRLLALERNGKNRFGQTLWLVRCDCGVETSTTLMNLRSGQARSCGCLRMENFRAASRRLRLGRGESSFRCLFAHYSRTSRLRRLEFTLDAALFRQIVTSTCYFCGAPPTQELFAHRQSFGAFVYNGIDRLDNALGYTPGNSVPCCKHCNYAKRGMSESEFFEWISRVYAHSIEVRKQANRGG